MLEPIKVKAIEAAVRTLTNLGCKIKVITPDGVEFGELAVAPVKTKTIVNSFIQTDYREQVRALKIGDVATIQWADAGTVDGLRAAMVSCGIRAFGKGSMTSDIDRLTGSVTVLRVA